MTANKKLNHNITCWKNKNWREKQKEAGKGSVCASLVTEKKAKKTWLYIVTFFGLSLFCEMFVKSFFFISEDAFFLHSGFSFLLCTFRFNFPTVGSQTLIVTGFVSPWDQRSCKAVRRISFSGQRKSGVHCKPADSWKFNGGMLSLRLQELNPAGGALPSGEFPSLSQKLVRLPVEREPIFLPKDGQRVNYLPCLFCMGSINTGKQCGLNHVNVL